jgi:hypothetical protein
MISRANPETFLNRTSIRDITLKLILDIEKKIIHYDYCYSRLFVLVNDYLDVLEEEKN